MTIKLGIIGMSEGNGHPYSWSAICNGYDANKMKICPFPVIYDYLSKEIWPESKIPNATVTHIWTQDPLISMSVRECSLIPNICNNIQDMIDNVDAVLLARDDSENHFKFSKDIITSGLPVFIDKPIATNLKEMRKLYQLEQYEGQIFTCSSMRFSKSLNFINDYKDLGDIISIESETPKSWEKYAVHVIEPVVAQIEKFSIDNYELQKSDLSTTLNVKTDRGPDLTFRSTGKIDSEIKITIITKTSEKTYVFNDPFYAFKESLKSFLYTVINKKRQIPICETTRIVEIIENGI